MKKAENSTSESLSDKADTTPTSTVAYHNKSLIFWLIIYLIIGGLVYWLIYAYFLSNPNFGANSEPANNGIDSLY